MLLDKKAKKKTRTQNIEKPYEKKKNKKRTDCTLKNYHF